MTRHQYIALATLGAIGLLAGAYAFQHIGGLPPCKMCLWQRWPHAVAILLGLMILATRQYQFAIIGALAAGTTAVIGLYHSGVEQGWWEGPSSCSSGDISGLSTDELLDQILTAPVVRCDEIVWDLLGISMAGWNALLSFILMALWLRAAFLRDAHRPL